MNIQNMFIMPSGILQKRYEALRSFFVDKKSVEEIAQKYGYTVSSMYSLIRDFKQHAFKNKEFVSEYFFNIPVVGRKVNPVCQSTDDLIIALRKKFLSITDIKTILESQNINISLDYIYQTLIAEGFTRLPRRDKLERESVIINNKILDKNKTIIATKAQLLQYTSETFTSSSCGILVFLHYITLYGIDKIIDRSQYHGTTQIPKLNSILAFLALKLSNVRRYTADDMWCMDRGLGLFAGLNVLPKTAWFTSYSSSITRDANLKFLKSLTTLWKEYGLLSDTANLDFVAVPYWGDEAHLEKNWSGTRHRALNSVLAALAEDPDSGIITYGDTTLRRETESNTAVEFLDFYNQTGAGDIKYLVFDSKFTTYENLRKIEDTQKVKFITIRRRSQKIVDTLNAIDHSLWKKIKVPMAKGKIRYLNVYEQKIYLKDYGNDKELRQIAITGHGKIKPALIITNDFDLSQADIIRKYAQRWLVEKTIAEQTHFFHLNRLSSSIVIKVDFDLTMTILAHNLYRLFAKDLEGFNNNTAQTLYDKFIGNSGSIICTIDKITVQLKKKRNLPCLLEVLQKQGIAQISWLANKKISFEGATTT